MASIESIRKIGDVIFSAFVFIMSVTFFIMSFALPKNSALMPRLVSIFTAILDLPIMINIWRQKRSKGSETVKVPVYTTALIMFGYYFALIFFGYIVSSLLLVAIIARLIGQKNWIATVALSVILTGSTYFIFKMLFNVDLPGGMLLGA